MIGILSLAVSIGTLAIVLALKDIDKAIRENTEVLRRK